MELKVKYQYTYFIKPFLIKENKYKKYLLSLLKNEKFNLKFFEKERDLNIYSYFLPEVRDYIFPTFSYDKQKIKEFENYKPQIKYIEVKSDECKDIKLILDDIRSSSF